MSERAVRGADTVSTASDYLPVHATCIPVTDVCVSFNSDTLAQVSVMCLFWAEYLCDCVRHRPSSFLKLFSAVLHLHALVSVTDEDMHSLFLYLLTSLCFSHTFTATMCEQSHAHYENALGPLIYFLFFNIRIWENGWTSRVIALYDQRPQPQQQQMQQPTQQ